MKNTTTSVIAGALFVAAVFFSSSVMAKEMAQTGMMVSDAQCSGQIDRDLSYNNPDYRFN